MENLTQPQGILAIAMVIAMLPLIIWHGREMYVTYKNRNKLRRVIEDRKDV